MARSAEAPADVGHDYCAHVHRSGIFLYRGLVPDLSGGQGHRVEERLGRGVGSVHRRGFGQFFQRGGIGVTLLIPTVFTVNLGLLTLLFGLATFFYACFTTIANVLPSDLFQSESVASVSGLSGTGAAIGTILVFELAGHISFAGMILVLLLVRNTEATERGLVRKI